jgi:hypothetical protein
VGNDKRVLVAIIGGGEMDPLVKSALDRVNETLNHIPWKTLEEIKGKRSVDELESRNIDNRISKAVHAVDALKSALKTIW